MSGHLFATSRCASARTLGVQAARMGVTGRAPRVLVVDNLDSFTGSLVDYLRVLGAEVVVHRTPVPVGDADLLLFSPGPGRPEAFPWMEDLFAAGRPIFGVCLGMQAIAAHFGGQVVPARRVVHGRTSRVTHDGTGCFAGLPSPFRATRYHSLAVRDLPDTLVVTARTADGEIMGLRHRDLPIEGVQFHPEAIRTEHGHALLANVLRGLR